MKKNFLFGLLAIGLAGFGFGGVSLAGGYAAQIGETPYATLQAAIDAAEAGQTVELLLDLQETPTIDGKNIILDLGNNTLTVEGYGLDVYNSTLVVKNGIIKNDDEDGNIGIYLNYGNNFTLDSTAKITGTGFGITSDLYPHEKTETNTVVINGEIDVDATAISISAESTLTVNNGAKVEGEDGIVLSSDAGSSNITLNGLIKGSNVAVTINGNITSTTKYPTITIGSNTEIVTDGNETVGLYLAGYGKTTIADGVRISGTASAVEIRAGDLTINGGTFTSTADSFSITPNGNGSTTVGAAIAVSQHTTNSPINIVINGGTFTGVKALHEEDIQDEAATGDISISVISGMFNGEVSSENVVNFIIGGIFSVDPSDYIDTGYTVLEKESNFYVMSLVDAATDESNTANVQLPEGVTVNTGAGDVTLDLSADITAYLSGDIDTAVSIEGDVLTGEIQDAGYQGATIVGTVSLDFGGIAVFSTPIAIRIPISGTNPVKVKVKHGGDAYGYKGLTLSPDAACNDDGSIAGSDAYAGSDITPINGYAVIYTCSASTFVAYTETVNQSSSSTSGGGGGGGSSKKDETKVETGTTDTGDTVDADTTGVEEGTNEENKPPLTAEEEQAAVAKFGQEQIDAYKWALENGITTMKTVESARLDQPLTRAELAKMMVVYIQKVVGQDPVLALDVTYADVDESLGDLAGYIKLAYQYQIMGINADGTPIEKFNPYGLVTRGEYATVFSRVLFGSKFNKEGADFYTNHLAALARAGILTNITPTIQEIRGWVMLMMYRSSQNGEKIQTVASETEEVNEEEKAETPVNEEVASEETTVSEKNNTEVNEEDSSNKTEETTENNETPTESEATETTGDIVSE